jgi:Flp pilus assembly protein TadD
VHVHQVLKIEPENIKALYRRGKSYLEENDLDNAERDLNLALKIDKNDKDIQVN